MLCRIEQRAFPGQEIPWTEQDYIDFGRWKNKLLITDDEVSAGLIAVQVAADEAEILNLGVIPERRRRGLAQELLLAAEVSAGELGGRRMFLEVAVDNDAARQLYGRSDYHEIGRRKDYYLRSEGHRVDAIVLSKDLPKKAG